jgi:ubiquinone/menaquinone biosynthesis C-methylase UbiE
MTKQNFYRKQYEKINPTWEESIVLYRDMIDELVEDKVVLDIGCGHGDLLEEAFKKAKDTYGIDPDIKAIERNKFIKHLQVADAENLPFQDNFFDIVTMAWVVEHLEHPEVVLKEINRVLKPGGFVCFLTPNKLNYNVWIIRAIPHIFHDFLTRTLYGRQENDTFKVQYRMNTPKEVEMLMGKSGFVRNALILNGDPSYISFNNILFKIACFFELILDKFPNHRVHLIGSYKKRS